MKVVKGKWNLVQVSQEEIWLMLIFNGQLLSRGYLWFRASGLSMAHSFRRPMDFSALNADAGWKNVMMPVRIAKTNSNGQCPQPLRSLTKRDFDFSKTDK